MFRARLWAVAAAACLVFSAAHADDELEAFNSAVEAASGHHRVALGYLRTGNLDFALVEVERMAEAWGAVTARFGSVRPAAFDGNEAYSATLLDVSTRIVTAHLLLSTGRPEPAQSALLAIRQSLAEMRRASAVHVLADCVLDGNELMKRAMTIGDGKPDLASEDTRAKLAKAGADYLATLQRCDALAPPALKGDPNFRRLIDGASASLSLWPKAVEMQDGDLLYRLLIELRSFDHLLAFRYG